MRKTFKTCHMDILDFIEILKRISFILNSRPVELILGAYSKEGGAQEIDSNLPDSWTCVTPNDLLLGDDGVGSARTSYIASGPLRLEKLDEKVRQWYMAFLAATQDKLF